MLATDVRDASIESQSLMAVGPTVGPIIMNGCDFQQTRLSRMLKALPIHIL